MRLIVGVNNIEATVRQEEEYSRSLAQAQTKASVDALTGVKNRHSYLAAEEDLDRRIIEGIAPSFAIAMLDVNDLKKVNDSLGHSAGDQLIRDACKVICDTFSHSPVFRVGGDEFVVISQGSDYDHMDELVVKIREHNKEAKKSGGPVLACGMSRYMGDDTAEAVFERADHAMYEDKAKLKGEKLNN